jgi:hypothetical protein
MMKSNQTFRKTITLLTILALCAISPVMAEGVIVSLNDQSAVTGSSVTFPITVTNAEELSEASFEISYDPAILKFKGTTIGAISRNGIIEATEIRPGTTIIDFSDTSGVSQNGELITVLFDVIGAEGSSTQIGLVAKDLRNLDNNNVPVEIIGGNLTVAGKQNKAPLSSGIAVIALGVVVLVMSRRFGH